MHRLIRQQQLPPGVAAKHLSVSVDAIRVTLEEHPAPRHRRPPTASTTVRRAGPALSEGQPRATPITVRRPLRTPTPACATSPRRSASASRPSPNSPATTAYPARPQSPRKYTFDRDWLYREHVIKGRPLAELARERGVSGATMTKNAKMHNIPVRRLGRHTPDALNSDQNIPSVLKPALAGQGDGNVCNASPRSLDSLPFRPPQRTSIPTEPRSVTRSP